VTAVGPSFDDRTRAGAEKLGPNQPPHRLHAPARSPPRHRGCQNGAALAAFIPLPKLAVCHTQYSSARKNTKSVFPRRIEPTSRVFRVYDLSTGPKCSVPSLKRLEILLKRIIRDKRTRYPGYCDSEYSEYPPSEGQNHPGRPGPLRAWVGAPRPGPATPRARGDATGRAGGALVSGARWVLASGVR
jgi:hypothetical protein